MDIKNTAITAQVVIESLLTLLENENVDIASIKFKVGGADQEYESSEMRFQDLIDIAFKGLDEIEGDYVLVPRDLAKEVPEGGRTDLEIIDQTIALVDILASSTNCYQRDPQSGVYPFESNNPRVKEWWRAACQIQELLTNTDPENCDFEEYKAAVETAENKES